MNHFWHTYWYLTSEILRTGSTFSIWGRWTLFESSISRAEGDLALRFLFCSLIVASISLPRPQLNRYCGTGSNSGRVKFFWKDQSFGSLETSIGVPLAVQALSIERWEVNQKILFFVKVLDFPIWHFSKDEIVRPSGLSKIIFDCQPSEGLWPIHRLRDSPSSWD